MKFLKEEDTVMKESVIKGKAILTENGESDVLEFTETETTRQSSKGDSLIHISEREKEVLQWVEQGKSSSEISLILGISQRTVNSSIYNIMEKLEAVNRPQMVAIALRKGILL